MDQETLTLFFAWYFIFVFSTVLHEAAHAFVAWKLGDPTAYYGGQVTLNPIPHMQRAPFGMVVAPIAMFFLSGRMLGWASAPYNPHWARRFPKRAALMALAGPMANLFLGLVAFAALKTGYELEFFSGEPGSGLVHGVWLLLIITFQLNLLLLVLNLFPFPPLDGSAVVQLFMQDRLARKYQDFIDNPNFALMGLMAAMILVGKVFPPILAWVLRLL